MRGQDTLEPNARVPIAAEAWEAGCLNRAELESITTALCDLREPRFTQQEFAELLDPERVDPVFECLLEIPAWRAFFSEGLRHTGRTEATSLVLLLDKSSASNRFLTEGQFSVRHRDRRGVAASFRGRSDGRNHALDVMSVEVPLATGGLHVGRLSARVGQGLLLWTPGPFDGLGGMEGSHRVGGGISGAAFLQRGIQEGVGWERTVGLGFRGPDWMMMGRSWPDRRYSASFGGGKNALRWAIRAVQRLDARWSLLAGLDGGMAHGGWSIRWAMAVFDMGWDARFSVLHTWSRNWEAHFLMEREDPANPRFWSGELRAALPRLDAQPVWKWNAGVAFQGKLRGWIRTSFEWEGYPAYRVRRRSALRLEQKGHRLEFKTDWKPTGTALLEWRPPDFAWSLAWRKTVHPDGGDKWQWRMELVLTGQPEGLGAAVAGTMQAKTRRGGRLRWGVGECWGSPEAPVRYLHGWNGRPAMPFSGTRSRVYFQWSLPNGHWRFLVQLSMSPTVNESAPLNPKGTINAFRVEFRLSS